MSKRSTKKVERRDERPSRAHRLARAVRPARRVEDRADGMPKLTEILGKPLEREIGIEGKELGGRVRHIYAARLRDNAEPPREEDAQKNRPLPALDEQKAGEDRAGERQQGADAVGVERDILEADHRDERSLVVHDNPRRLHRDQADVKAYSRRDSLLERNRNRVEDALAHRRERQREKNQTLHKYSQERKLPAIPHAQHHAVREEGVEAHPRREDERVVRHERHQERAYHGRHRSRHEHAAARDPRIREDVRVHGQDVRHRHERGDARHDLRPDGRAVAVQLEETP